MFSDPNSYKQNSNSIVMKIQVSDTDAHAIYFYTQRCYTVTVWDAKVMQMHVLYTVTLKPKLP